MLSGRFLAGIRSIAITVSIVTTIHSTCHLPAHLHHPPPFTILTTITIIITFIAEDAGDWPQGNEGLWVLGWDCLTLYAAILQYLMVLSTGLLGGGALVCISQPGSCTLFQAEDAG